MKLGCYIVIILVFSGCLSKRLEFDASSQDIYMFKTVDKKTEVLGSDITKKDISIQLRGWGSVDVEIDHKAEAILTQKSDTMQLLCFCGRFFNYYFKNVPFKKGTYFIQVNDIMPLNKQSVYKTKGEKLSAPKSIQKILFKNSLVRDLVVGFGKSDLLLKDIEFTVIDLSDTVSIKLVPMSKEDFWDSNFKPNTN